MRSGVNMAKFRSNIMNLVQIEQLWKGHRGPKGADEISIFKGANFSMNEGETVAIVGPSGAGKSTLLHLLAGLDVPDSGRMVVAGHDVQNLRGEGLAIYRRETIGVVFQQHHLLPQCSALENVLVPAVGCGGEKAKSLEKRGRELLEMMGLKDRMQHRPGELSGGERQRVAVARALLFQPKLILADEPTGALDRSSAERLTEVFLKINEEYHVGLLVVTHSEELANRMGSIYTLRDGTLGRRV